MSEPTLVVDAEEIAAGRVVVRGDSYRHLFRARRLAGGDTLRLVDGAGRAVAARVDRITGGSAELAVVGEAPSNESSVRLEIWVGPPRAPRASWLVEKVTELGVDAVRWIDSERSGRRPADAGLARLERVARSAVEQCGRARVPRVTGPHAWKEVVATASQRPSWVLDAGFREATAVAGLETDDEATGPAMMIVGPEGGLTVEEITQLDDVGVRRLGLGARVLRVETAAVAGAAILMASLRSARPR